MIIDARAGELRRHLQVATRDVHTRLDSALDLLRAPPEQTRFVHLLERFHGFHRGWETALVARLAGDAAWLVTRGRLLHIEADLRALGRNDCEIACLPICPGANALCADEAAALGSLYVMEGSTLGGKVIARHVAHAAWYPLAGLTYFDPYGAHTAARWHEIVIRLDAVPHQQWPAVELGAIATFAWLESWLPASIAAPGEAGR
ncbi:MAG: biliverdin-producing heme oxygenase [Betaproteobacteria bacterium]